MFTNGELFQLKDWPPQETQDQQSEAAKHTKVVNLFHRVKGFFLHF